MTNPPRHLVDPPLLTATEVSTVIVPGSALLSSQGRVWNDIEVVRRRHSTDELKVPPLASHLLVIYQGAPSVAMAAHIGDKHYTHTLHTGALAIVPASSANSWQWSADAPMLHDSLHIYLHPRRLHLDAAHDPTPELQSSFGIDDPQIVALGHLLLAELEQRGVGEQLYVDGLTNLLAVHLLRHYTASSQPSPQPSHKLAAVELAQITDYIEATLSQPITLAELANVIHLSPYHFARMFKQTIGQSPHQYVITRRVERARQLLLIGDLAIAEIASIVGFADQSHLTAHFRRQLGVTPAQFRQSATFF